MPVLSKGLTETGLKEGRLGRVTLMESSSYLGQSVPLPLVPMLEYADYLVGGLKLT